MDFKTKKLRKETKPPKKIFQSIPTFQQIKERKNSINIHYFTVGGSISLLLILILGIYIFVQSLDFSAIVFSFGKTLQTDTSGKTNFLLVGVGGEGHDGANLTDTIIVASIDYKNKIVPMLSIPRDFYIESNKIGNQRINSVYYFSKAKFGDKEGMYHLKETLEQITGLKIQYYVKVDFGGFEQIVDSIDGVDLEVENAIYDPYYPKGETIYYETFQISKGMQHLDGKTALKYARSRKTTSDFDRARRQQQLLYAIKDKAFSLNILTNPGKIKALYDSVADSIETNLTLTEIIELGKFSKEFNKDDVFPLVINDNPADCGGLVYTPVREYFGGASVLLPAGNNYDYINLFVDKTFNNINAVTQKEEIQVLNGTKTPGLALTTLEVLNRFCMNAVYYSNAADRTLETTTIYYKEDEEGNPPKILDVVKAFVPGVTVAGIPQEYLASEKRQNTAIVIELGSDYLSKRMKDPFSSLKYTAPIIKADDKKETDLSDTAPSTTSSSESQTQESINDNS
jgi:LCP family protein required for cell wall assembly